MTVKTTLYLDEQLAERLRRVVAERKLNRFINDTLAAKIDEIESEKLEAEMKAGYLAVAEDRNEVTEDWSSVETEDWPS